MKFSFLPKTVAGKWSVGLVCFTFLGIGILYVFAERLSVITSEMAVRIFGTSSVLSSVAAFFVGISAIIKNKERSVLVLFAILIGFGAMVLLAGELTGLW